MTIYIEDLKFQCIIGILDFEREQQQDIVVNLEIDYDFIGTFINYADVAELIKSTMITNKFLLIEDALEALSQSLKNNFTTIKSLNLKITKPAILSDCSVSVGNFYNFHS